MKGVPDLVLRPGAYGTFLVPDVRGRAYTLRVGGTDQSFVDLDDPLRLEFDYVQRFADVADVVFAPGARIRVVHVGGAAMTFPRYVAATRPQSAQIVLEPDAELTAFVRLHLPLPRTSGIKVREVDGRVGVAALADGRLDLMVLDAFAGSRVPAELGTVEFFTDVSRTLAPTGVVMMNLTDRGPLPYGRRVLAALGAVFPNVVLLAEPSTLKGRRFGNVILVGARRDLALSAVADRAGRPPFPYRLLHGPRLTQLVGAAAPYTAADAEPSPVPPEDLLGLG